MKVGSLFSGIGGLDLGFERAGFDIAWMCEKDLFCRSVLAHHWPGIPIYEDVHDLSSESVPGVDVLIGGFPCQPFSVAGKQRGHEDERYLWPEAMRLVRELRPDWCCFENVPGIRAIGADRVCEDLESEGYSVWPLVVGADDVGAPHKRKRVFFVARLSDSASDLGRAGDPIAGAWEATGTLEQPWDLGPSHDGIPLLHREQHRGGKLHQVSDAAVLAHGNGGRREQQRIAKPGRIERASGDEPDRCDLPMAYAESSGRTSEGNGGESGSRSGCDGSQRAYLPDSVGTRLEGRESQPGNDGAELPTAERIRCELGNSSSHDQRRPGTGPGGQQGEAGRSGASDVANAMPSGSPSERFGWDGRQVGQIAHALYAGRWPAGPGQEQHAWEPTRTVPGLGRVPHGLPGWVDSATRRHRLKSLGNAVVPQVSEVIARAILTLAADRPIGLAGGR